MGRAGVIYAGLGVDRGRLGTALSCHPACGRDSTCYFKLKMRRLWTPGPGAHFALCGDPLGSCACISSACGDSQESGDGVESRLLIAELPPVGSNPSAHALNGGTEWMAS